jgi:flagellar L-ring protein FlgH
VFEAIMRPTHETRSSLCVRFCLAAPTVMIAILLERPAVAQDASLAMVHAIADQPPLTLENSSFIYQKLPPEAEFRELKIHDIIKVLVDYRSTMKSEGEANNKKTANIQAALTDWLGFDGSDIYAAPQTKGDPAIAGKLNSQYKAQAELDSKDSLTFTIAAEIIDIQPNGNLVIEAHRTIQINDEQWQQSLTGIVRRSSILADRTVRSDEVADLRIDKREMGAVRDGYRRGWFLKWYDKWKPL